MKNKKPTKIIVNRNNKKVNFNKTEFPTISADTYGIRKYV